MALSIFTQTILRARGIGRSLQKLQKSRGYKPGVATVKLPKKQAHALMGKMQTSLKGLRKQQITGMKAFRRGSGHVLMNPFKTPLQIKKQYAKVFKTSRFKRRISAEKTWRKWIEKKGGLIVSKRELQAMKSIENPRVLKRFGKAVLKKERLLPLSNKKKFLL
tara:strand:+ start:54 stop:542 length:489 start_codon:yes stop_codon:yes gene_type:complete